jgi:hypothetical protein
MRVKLAVPGQTWNSSRVSRNRRIVNCRNRLRSILWRAIACGTDFALFVHQPCGIGNVFNYDGYQPKAALGVYSMRWRYARFSLG